MEIWIIWLVAAVILLVLEVLSQAVWSLCLAIGCLVAAALSVFSSSLALQGIGVGVSAVAAWILLAPVIRKWESRRSGKAVTGMDALLGRRAVVIGEIRPGELGRARIDGDSWQVQAPGAAHTIAVGSEVIVTAYDSNILSVEEQS